MEGTMSFAQRLPVTRHAGLVEQVAELARIAQRPRMSAAEARAFLCVSHRQPRP
jgi:3-keto-5-aminohexanoate cleavage enzyme